MEREVGGGIRMGNTCKPMAVSFQCMTKFTTNKKKIESLKKKKEYVDQDLPDVQAGFRKSRGTRDQTANICWILEKAREFQKNISVQFSCSVVSDSL